MMRRSMFLTFTLSLVLGLAGCTGVDSFYEKEYVIRDGKQAAPQQTGTQSNRAQGSAGQPEAAADRAGAGEAMTPTEAASAADGELVIAAGIGVILEDDLERIFVLESLHDELGRAIRDGVGDLEALQRKQLDVDRELAWRRIEVGDDYAEARRERLELLREFPVVVK